jgi:hypothetical protein
MTLVNSLNKGEGLLNNKGLCYGNSLIAGQRVTSNYTTFDLTSTGDGTGVSTLTLTVSEDMTLSLDGAGKFYTDAAGTLNESSTWDVTTGAARTIYLKVTSGTSVLSIPKNKITEWNAWTSSTNAASLDGDISKLTPLTYLYVADSNTISGSVAALTSLTYLYVTGSNTLSGSVAALTSLTYLRVLGSNTLSGSVAALTSLTRLQVTGSNTLSGSITGLTSLTFLIVTGSNTISGSVAALTSLTFVYVTGSNTISGSVAALTSLTYLYVTGSNTLSGSVAALTSLTYLRVLGSNTLSGSVAALTSLTRLQVTGSNTLSGSITGLTSLTFLIVTGSNTLAGDLNPIVSDLTPYCYLVPCTMIDYTSGATWGNATINIQPSAGYGYDSTEIDNMLIDMAASNSLSGKTITLTGSSAARTAASDIAVTKLETTDSGYVHEGCTIITNP